MPWDIWVIFLVLGLVLPWRGRARMKKLLALPRLSTMERLSLYASTIAFQWLAVAVVAWRAWVHGFTASQFGLIVPDRSKILIAAVVGTATIASLSVAEPATHGENSCRSARLPSSHRGTHFAAIYGGVASLSRASDNCGPLRGVSLSRIRHGRSPPRWITSMGGSAAVFRPFRAGAQLPGARRDCDDALDWPHSRDEPVRVREPGARDFLAQRRGCGRRNGGTTILDAEGS